MRGRHDHRLEHELKVEFVSKLTVNVIASSMYNNIVKSDYWPFGLFISVVSALSLLGK